MPFAINFELSDRDLEQFNAAIQAARAAAGNKTADEVIAAATSMLEDSHKLEMPGFEVAADRKSTRLNSSH